MTDPPSRDDTALLDARAAELARPLQDESDAQQIEMLVLNVGDRQVAVPVEHLSEVRPPSRLTRVPAAGGALVGLLGGHSGTLAVASLAQLLGLVPQVAPDEQWVAVLHDGAAPLGLLADSAEGVLRVSERDLTPLPDVGGLVMAGAPGGTLVLDPAAVLTDARVFFTPPRPMEELPWDDA